MGKKLNILFICTINQMRSRTAEDIYKSDSRFNTRSAGLAQDALVLVDLDLLQWADYILVMEEKHRKRLKRTFPELYPRLKIFCLDIPDMYFHMSPELIKRIRQSFESLYKTQMVPGVCTNDTEFVSPDYRKLKILFICTINKMRSKTAEMIYKQDSRFQVKSAGIADDALVPVNLELLVWADYIIAMEEEHLEWLRQSYPIISSHKHLISLDIPDIYDFMESALVDRLKLSFEAVYSSIINKNNDTKSID